MVRRWVRWMNEWVKLMKLDSLSSSRLDCDRACLLLASAITSRQLAHHSCYEFLINFVLSKEHVPSHANMGTALRITSVPTSRSSKP
jgi:hypothetical protein